MPPTLKALLFLVSFLASAGCLAQSTDPKHPSPLAPGVNKGNIDNMTGGGGHFYYFWAGPGHIAVKMAFKEMGLLGNPYRQSMSFDFFREQNKPSGHTVIVSQGKLERISTTGDLKSREKFYVSVLPQKGLIRLGGYYEIEITGVATFDGAANTSNVRPQESEALVKSAGGPLVTPGGPLITPGGPLVKSGGPLVKPVKALIVRETARETRVTLAADVLFDFDKAVIRPDATADLRQLAMLIRQKAHGVVRIEGYTDAKGENSYNVRLSRQRAAAVQSWLVATERFPANTFSILGFGSARPVAPNTNPDGSDDVAGRQRNRRVEIIIAK